MHKPRQKVIHNPIPTSFFQDLNPFYVGIWISVYIVRFCIMCFLCNSFEHNQRCRDLLVPFLFHEVTSLYPPSFHRNIFSTCIPLDGSYPRSLQTTEDSVRVHPSPLMVPHLLLKQISTLPSTSVPPSTNLT